MFYRFMLVENTVRVTKDYGWSSVLLVKLYKISVRYDQSSNKQFIDVY